MTCGDRQEGGRIGTRFAEPLLVSRLTGARREGGALERGDHRGEMRLDDLCARVADRAGDEVVGAEPEAYGDNTPTGGPGRIDLPVDPGIPVCGGSDEAGDDLDLADSDLERVADELRAGIVETALHPRIDQDEAREWPAQMLDEGRAQAGVPFGEAEIDSSSHADIIGGTRLHLDGGRAKVRPVAKQQRGGIR